MYIVQGVLWKTLNPNRQRRVSSPDWKLKHTLGGSCSTGNGQLDTTGRVTDLESLKPKEDSGRRAPNAKKNRLWETLNPKRKGRAGKRGAKIVKGKPDTLTGDPAWLEGT